jgi:D-alanyl-lipoteichoic acid acyltransferase DltB (MBOAT superfamily)
MRRAHRPRFRSSPPVRVTDGLKQMFCVLFKKVVIADRLAVLVDSV